MVSLTNKKVMVVNLLASVLSNLLNLGNLEISLYTAVEEYQSIHEYVREKIREALTRPVSEEERMEFLLQRMNELLKEAESEKSKVITQMAIVEDIDQRITYEDCEDVSRISLKCLTKATTDEVVNIKALNTNGKELGVFIHPKFPVSSARVLYEEWKDRPFAIRNIHQGLNAHLRNILYFPIKFKDCLGENHTYNVHSLIIPEHVESPQVDDETVKTERDTTRIGFSPISNIKSLLKTVDISAEAMPYHVGNIPYKGISVEEITDASRVEKGFENAFYEACKCNLDVFFSAEMLCTEKMKAVTNGQSDYLKPLIWRARLNGLSVPKLILLPTRWENSTNYLLIFDEDGTLLGKQYKHTPYVDEKHGKVEALDMTKASDDIYLIHLKNRQRIAIVICAEFLANLDYVREFLCGWLGVTLILVPSYSKGEQDFVASLPIYNNYGVNVIWGDCCGAVKQKEDGKRIIGGCSYAGTDTIKRFGDCVKCGFSCEGKQHCFFEIELSTRIKQEKPSSPEVADVRHQCD